MREDITSLPVSEVFEPRDGCPVCRMRDMLEQSITDYVTGAAMMEPDVRIETNEQGFCFPHYQMLLKKQQSSGRSPDAGKPVGGRWKSRCMTHRLPLWLQRQNGQTADKPLHSCFVCRQVDWAMERMLQTVCRLWEREEDFRKLFSEQPHLCLPHFSQLSATAAAHMGKKNAPDFIRQAADLSRNYLKKLRGDVTHFCQMFDYRNNGGDADWGNSRDSIERAIRWLTSRVPD